MALPRCALSVLSVEPYGMKPRAVRRDMDRLLTFSALGRAVWDETVELFRGTAKDRAFSALGRAVWDETRRERGLHRVVFRSFSALGRAVWDET